MFGIKLSESTALRRRVPVYLVDMVDGKTEETGVASPTIVLSVNGAADVSGVGTFQEVGSGLYYYQFTAAEVGSLGWLRLRVEKVGTTRPYNALVLVTAYDPYDTVSLGLSGITDASANSVLAKTAADTAAASSATASTNSNTAASQAALAKTAADTAAAQAALAKTAADTAASNSSTAATKADLAKTAAENAESASTSAASNALLAKNSADMATAAATATLEILTGDGVWVVAIQVQDGSGPLGSIRVVVQNTSGDLVAWGLTDTDTGEVSLNLDNGDYLALIQGGRGFDPIDPVEFTVDGANQVVSITLTPRTPTPPADPALCVVECNLAEIDGTPLTGTVTARLTKRNQATDDTVYSKQVLSSSIVDGYAELQLIRSTEFLAGDGEYTIEVTDGDVKSVLARVLVPDQDAVTLSELLASAVWVSN